MTMDIQDRHEEEIAATTEPAINTQPAQDPYPTTNLTLIQSIEHPSSTESSPIKKRMPALYDVPITITDALPEPDLASARTTLAAVHAMSADYWSLHRFFGKIAGFKATFNKKHLDVLLTHANALFSDVETDDDAQQHGLRYYAIQHLFDQMKRDLTSLRIGLEGEWFQYPVEVTYQVIGNQPNRTRTGPVVRPYQLPPPKFILKVNEAHDESMSSPKSTNVVAATMTESELIAPGTKSHQLIIHEYEQQIVHNKQEIGHFKQAFENAEKKRKEAQFNFAQTVKALQEQIEDLESSISRTARHHAADLADKDQIIARSEALVEHKDFLIEKHKKWLALQGYDLDDRGEMVFLSIGSRGMAFNFEDGEIRELKKRKTGLHADVIGLQRIKDKLTAETKNAAPLGGQQLGRGPRRGFGQPEQGLRQRLLRHTHREGVYGTQRARLQQHQGALEDTPQHRFGLNQVRDQGTINWGQSAEEVTNRGSDEDEHGLEEDHEFVEEQQEIMVVDYEDVDEV